MGIEQLFSSARRGVQLLSLTGVLSCISLGPSGPPAYQPKPRSDYERYPGWKREIAFYEIKKILEENCNTTTINETSLYCSTSDRNYHMSLVSTQWDEIKSVGCRYYPGVGVEYSIVLNENEKVKNCGHCEIFIRNNGQAQAGALEQAIKIYVGIK